MRKLKILAALAVLVSLSAQADPIYTFRIFSHGIQAGAAAPQSALYAFSSFTFNPCGATGASGPNLSGCQGAYAGATFVSNSALFTVSGGIQSWTVPATGTYLITAAGAQGGYPTSTASCTGSRPPSRNGYGAVVQTSVQLTQGTVLEILVGQSGAATTSAGGGGGGTFVVANNSPIAVAGGGGGASYCDGMNPLDGTTSQAGTVGYGTTGGANGSGATSIYQPGWGSGGAGFLTDGANNTCGIAHSFMDGGTASGSGGFGGGGSGCGSYGAGGGGGGYSGGGDGGGGGGSYYAGALLSSSTNAGQGYVTIQKQ